MVTQYNTIIAGEAAERKVVLHSFGFPSDSRYDCGEQVTAPFAFLGNGDNDGFTGGRLCGVDVAIITSNEDKSLQSAPLCDFYTWFCLGEYAPSTESAVKNSIICVPVIALYRAVRILELTKTVDIYVVGGCKDFALAGLNLEDKLSKVRFPSLYHILLKDSVGGIKKIKEAIEKPIPQKYLEDLLTKVTELGGCISFSEIDYEINRGFLPQDIRPFARELYDAAISKIMSPPKKPSLVRKAAKFFTGR